jgi:zinc/manganese transport system substrate-binding protein
MILSRLLFPRLMGSIFLLLLTLLTACGTTTSGEAGPVQVVAAENFWGSIASQIGGSHVHVTNIIAGTNADPHDYEPTTADARIVADAQYVIVNGAGYDPWANKLLQASPSSKRKVLNVGDLNGKHEGDNPHLWYNPDYVKAVANKMRDDLKAIDPAHASDFDTSTQAFLNTGLQRYDQLIKDIKATYQGTPIGATESIFAYMAPALGLNLITPDSYLKAASEGEDISASDQATMEQQIRQHAIKVLISNSQNTPNNIQALKDLAKSNGIPITDVTETPIPATRSFQDWQVEQLERLQKDLAQATGK